MRNWIKIYLRKHPIEGLIQLATIVLFALNIWLSISLFPLVSDILHIRLQVNAMQTQIDKNTKSLEENAGNTIEIKEVKEDLKDIKDAAIRLEHKVDQIYQHLIP